jgi:hypothetical protein
MSPFPAGYERVFLDAGDGGEPIVFRAIDPPRDD